MALTPQIKKRSFYCVMTIWNCLVKKKNQIVQFMFSLSCEIFSEFQQKFFDKVVKNTLHVSRGAFWGVFVCKENRVYCISEFWAENVQVSSTKTSIWVKNLRESCQNCNQHIQRKTSMEYFLFCEWNFSENFVRILRESFAEFSRKVYDKFVKIEFCMTPRNVLRKLFFSFRTVRFILRHQVENFWTSSLNFREMAWNVSEGTI